MWLWSGDSQVAVTVLGVTVCCLCWLDSRHRQMDLLVLPRVWGSRAGLSWGGSGRRSKENERRAGTHIYKGTVYTQNSLLLSSPAAFQGPPLRFCHWYKLPPKSGLQMDKSPIQVWPRGERKGLALHHHTYRYKACLPLTLKFSAVIQQT